MNEATRAHKPLIKLIERLNVEYTAKQALQKEADLLRFQLERTQALILEMEVKQNQLIIDVSVCIMNFNQAAEENRQNNLLNEVFLEDDGERQERRQLRATLNELSSIVTFVYCNDNTSPITEAQLNQIAQHLR